MNDTLISTISELCNIITGNDHINRVTLDKSRLKPAYNEVHAFVAPPSIEWTTWTQANATFSVLLVAGTMATQEHGFDLLYKALDQLAQSQIIDIRRAEPAAYVRPEDGGELAAYTLTINVTMN